MKTPKTISEVPEMHVPGINLYLTMEELTYVAVIAGLAKFGGDAISQKLGIPIAALVLVVMVVLVGRYKEGKPASWLFDLRASLNSIPGKRGILKPKKGLTRMSWHRRGVPAPFVSGVTKPGQDLSCSAPWMVDLPPATPPPLLMVPRNRRVVVRAASMAPPWMHGCVAFLDAQGRPAARPILPLSIDRVRIEAEDV